MPEVQRLRRVTVAGETFVSFGNRVVFRYAAADTAMRNLAVVALTEGGVRGLDAAEVFGLTAPYISRLRGRARREGSAGLVARRGRPSKLSAKQQTTARRLAAEGTTQAEIAKRFGVAPSAISNLLGKTDPASEEGVLGQPDDAGEPVTEDLVAEQLPLSAAEPAASEEPATAEPAAGEEAEDEPAASAQAPGAGDEPSSGPVGDDEARPAAPDQAFLGLARVPTGTRLSRYAGTVVLYAYLSLLGASGVFSVLSSKRARRYDDLAVIATALVGFALGAGTVEGIKHLRRSDAGAVVGLAAIPELRTLRERLSELADGSDPLALQREFAKHTRAADPPTSPVYYVDDHFVAYTGGRPVAKGWNTERRHAEPGRDDTLVCDERGRAVVFASGEPSGLSSTMGSVLSQLREVTGEGRLLIGFDRGGSYPVAFKALRAAGMDWVTYRRGKLVATKKQPRRRRCTRNGKRVTVVVADEMVTISGYGKARQLTLFERGAPVLQVLTSDMKANAAALVCWLRSRWRLENLFKYAMEHNGIDSIVSYKMDLVTDDRKIANPRRTELKKTVADTEAALADAERGLAKLLCDPKISVGEKNAAIGALNEEVSRAQAAAAEARAALKGVPAEIPRTEIDPDAKRAVMRPERRGLQMVMRLLVFNAEAYLAEHLNAYLEDPHEFRATMRNLLQLGGRLDYERDTITVTLDRPDTPRVARAYELLLEELNAGEPAHLLGDRRRLCYRLAAP